MIKLPYELHVTVKSSVDKFVEVAEMIGVKLIVLALQKRSGDVIQDMMTSSTIVGQLDDAVKEIAKISSQLSDEGIEVIRQKIETVPWHPDVPTLINRKSFDNGQHLETHLAIRIHRGQYPLLKYVAEQTECHLSKNKWKTFKDGSFTQMVTYRSYIKPLEEFTKVVDNIILMFRVYNMVVDKTVVEFCIQDNNTTHDLMWLN